LSPTLERIIQESDRLNATTAPTRDGLLGSCPKGPPLRAQADEVGHLAEQRGNVLRVDGNLLLIAYRIAGGFGFPIGCHQRRSGLIWLHPGIRKHLPAGLRRFHLRFAQDQFVFALVQLREGPGPPTPPRPRCSRRLRGGSARSGGRTTRRPPPTLAPVPGSSALPYRSTLTEKPEHYT